MVEEETAPAPRRRLLLVEDSEAIRDALSILLEDAGFTVVQAGRGQDALRLAAESRPDLVLLDLGLPDMAGLDVARQMRGDVSMAGVPIVAVTGRDEAADREACRVAGCDDYLVKPVNTRELVRRVAELV
jgi:DNA-binding response OmpR family regulator